MLLSMENVTFGYDGVPVLENASFAIHEGERVGFVGANGEGKTTVLRLLCGELAPDGGTIVRKNGLKAGYLAQTGGLEGSGTVYETMREVFREDVELIEKLRETELALSRARQQDFPVLSARIESLTKRIAARDSYHFDVRIRTVLGGMGFGDRTERTVSTMSGGEKTKLKLCRLLLEAPELLILDEPTNHLDLKTLFWLEEYLSGYRGAILVVSHDRYFLDRLTSRTLELERGKLSSFKGNYSRYKERKAERFKEEMRAYERQCEEIARLQDYVDRNIVRATTAKSALSRVNRLERMERMERPLPPAAPPRFRFETDVLPYERVIQTDSFDLCAGGNPLLRNARFSLSRGKKCALLGDNGTGKSTLLKFLLSGDPRVRLGQFVRTAYYDQENADLDPEARALDVLWSASPRLTQTEVRAVLARATLGAEDAEKRVSELSGGMRAKLAIAVLEAKRANFMLLDEPTNHLDLPAREALEEALRAYDGTLLFVSHDRRFIEAVADEIVLLENGTLTPFEGGYAEYLARRDKEQTAERPPVQKPAGDSHRTKEERAQQVKKAARIRDIESRLEAVEAEQTALNGELVRCAADYLRVRRITELLAELERESDSLYAEYETLI